LRVRAGRAAVAAFLGVTSLAAAASPPTLVFIHGIKGARLATDAGRVHWLTVAQALGLSTPVLALPTRFGDGGQERDALHPAGVLTTLILVPRLVEIDVYGRWLAAARALGRPFAPFAYDWRRDDAESVADFERFLEGVIRETGRPADVVAHSMGGLITLSLLNRRPDLFRRVVFAGVPFAGGIGFLPDLHVGRATGLNRRIAGPDVLATFPSVFTLFPLVNEHVVEADGSPSPMDFYDADAWKRLALGPYRPGARRDAAYERFLAEALRRAKAFRASLAPRPDAVFPPVLVVLSDAHPTLVRALRAGPHAEDGIDFTTLPRTDGDGRVSARNAVPPAPIRHEVVVTRNDHAKLLNDAAVVKRIAEFLDAP